MKRVHGPASFIYSVIVGLALREALVKACPGVFHLTSVESWKATLEAWRLVVFIFMIVRFYCASGIFFESFYLTDQPNADSSNSGLEAGYAFDFGLGLIHFLIFFAWSLTITDFSRSFWGLGPFLSFLAVILLFDLVWLALTRNKQARSRIKLWVILNVITVFISGALFFIIERGTGNVVIAEEVSTIVVDVACLVDFAEIFGGRHYVEDFIRHLLP